MRFADPRACPDCRAPLTGGSRCTQCGLDLSDPAVRELWQTLLRADELLTDAVRRRDARPDIPADPTPTTPTPERPVRPEFVEPPAPPEPARPEPAEPVEEPPTRPEPAEPDPAAGAPTWSSATFPAYPRPGDPFTAARPPTPDPATDGRTPPQPAGPHQSPGTPTAPADGSSWSVGTILLALGAFGLVAAAIIFVSRSWDTIGLIGKAGILGAATAAAAAAAIWVTRRPLRASAEAMWAVTLALLAVDLLGARGEGLLGLDSVPWPWVLLISGALLAGVSGIVLTWARPHVKTDLVVPAAASIGGIALAAIGASDLEALSDFWGAFAGLVVAGVLGLALRFTGSSVIAIGARVVVACFFIGSAALAVVEAVDHPSIEDLASEGHGLPLLLVSLAAVVVAATVPVLRQGMTAVGALGLGTLLVIASKDIWTPEGSWVAVSALAVGFAALGCLRTNGWIGGLRWATVGPVTVLLGFATWWVAELFHVTGVVTFEASARLGATERFDTSVADYAPAATVLSGVALVLVVWLVTLWPALPNVDHTGARVPLLAGATTVSVVGALLAFEAPWWALAASLSVLAVAAIGLGLQVGPIGWRQLWLFLLAAAAAVPALIIATVDDGLAASVMVALGLTTLAVVWSGARDELRSVSGLVAAPLLCGGAVYAVAAVDASESVAVIGAVVVAAAVLISAVWAPASGRYFLEGGAGVALLVTASSAPSTAVGAVSWSLIGVVLCAVALAVPDRRFYLWPGGAAFVIAYVLLVVDSGFDFVEAYTLPLAVLALAGGVALLAKRPETHSWLALGPGLALGLLPSLPQALAEPTGLRALLLGLASIVVLGVGAKFSRQAPFVLGVIVAALVVLFNIGPYANAAPRVAVIAAVSVLLVGLGITWEERVRDGRRVLAFVKDMS